MINSFFLGLVCYENYCIEKSYLLLLILPIFFVLLFIMYKDMVRFSDAQEKKRFGKRNKWFRFFILLSRTLMFLFLLISLAEPFTTEEVQTYGDPIIKLLVDSSESMNLFEADIVKNVKDKLSGEYSIELSQIASGKNSEIGDGILKRIEGNDNLVVLSDGNNNYGKSLSDVGIYSRISNTRIFGINIEPVRNDAYVEITGPKETISGTPNRFRVKVNYVGAQPAFTLQIYVDDVLEFSGQNIFEKEVLKAFGDGYHKITAKIILDDYFKANNVYYKTVKAVKKPKILFVSSSKSGLVDGLEEIYELTVSSDIPNDLSNYNALIFNDLPISKFNNKIDSLTGYLLDGNGVVFIGGRHSFDKGGYKESLVESLLPVKIGSGKTIQPIQHNIMIVLDVSESFSDYSYKEGGDKTALDLGKGLAVKMIDGFRDDINVGIVAFASLGQLVTSPVNLGKNREMLINMVKRLSRGEGTSIDQGLLMAEYGLSQAKGTKNLILISDGKMGHAKLPMAPQRVAQKMADQGIRIYTVGLPSELYEVDINRDLMRRLAEIGNGNYFEPDEFQYLNVFFGKPEEKEKVFSGSSNLAIMDRNHFITEELVLDAKVTGINFVVPKIGTKSLIFTGDGNPILNSWNFGLGRVVTLATDDGREWAASLVSKDNSMLLTRMINYAVGNPERDKEPYVQLNDGYLGDENEIFVKHSKYPTSKELTFVKVGEDSYKASFYPENEGYFQFFDSIVAINPPREYFNLGLNPQMQEMVSISGGQMLNLDEKDIAMKIKSYTVRRDITRKDLKLYPLAIVLLIFIIDLIIRKIYEHKKYRVKIK